MKPPVIYCPFCENIFNIPIHTDGVSRWFDWYEAQAICNAHIKSHADDYVQELEEMLSAS